MAEITLGKALKIKNRLTGRLAKVQADIQGYNSIPEGQTGQVNVPALMKTREELVGALVGLKTAINEDNREVQRTIYDLAEKKATAQFLAGVNTRHGPQPAVYPNTTEVNYVAALKKADVDALVAGLEKEIRFLAHQETRPEKEVERLLNLSTARNENRPTFRKVGPVERLKRG